jgi:hypothetical protein
MPPGMESQVWTAIESLATAYAATVATGALFLDVQRWVESRPKLIISLIPTPSSSEATHGLMIRVSVLVHVVNRGATATTIENLLVLEYPTGLQLLRKPPTRSFVVPQPQFKGYSPNLPAEILANKRWSGSIRKVIKEIPDLQTSTFYVWIAASHTNRTILKRIPSATLPFDIKPLV